MLILELAAEHLPATLLRQQQLARLVAERPIEVDLAASTATFADPAVLTDPDAVDADPIAASIQVVGTVNEAAHTFTWSWATPEAGATDGPTTVLGCAERLRDYGAEHDVIELSEAVWHLDDIDPFLLAAIARGWCRADALYRAPMPGGAVYLLLNGIGLPTASAHEIVQALSTGIAMAPVDHRAAAMALFADVGVPLTGMDEMLVATVGPNLVNVAFTRDGRIDDLSVTAM